MEIRKSTPEDIPEIVDLLRVSLGESLIPKSTSLWNWKHVENPFGTSPVLLGVEDGRIVGVRAFLRWDFANQDTLIKSCRAVDTAVHPDFQGKGVFTKLTMGLVKEISEQGLDSIFNTPNAQSTPGYLKMGWEKSGQLPLSLGIRLLRSSEFSIPKPDWTQVSELVKKLETKPPKRLSFSTHIRPGYISWRYENCPLFPYYFLSDGESFLLIFRIKEGKWGNEFRICDLFTTEEFSKAKEVSLQRDLKNAIKNSGCRLISYSGLQPNQALGLRFLPKLSLGPMVTFRQIKHDFLPKEQKWAWSIGDLEVL